MMRSSRAHRSPGASRPGSNDRSARGGGGGGAVSLPALSSRSGAAASARSRSARSGSPGASNRYGRSARGGGGGRATDERRAKITAKKMRDLMRQEGKDRAAAEVERDAFVEQITADFDVEREQMMTKTVNRLNGEVAHLKAQLSHTEATWRGKWRRVVGEGAGRLNDTLHGEGVVGENTISALVQAAEDGRNFNELAETLSKFAKSSEDSVQKLKREKLDEQLRGDEFKMKFEERTKQLDAADRLIRTHLVGRGSEATIAVELFRKQGMEFERRFKAMEREFLNRVDRLLKDSASIEMVGQHNHEDAIIAKLKLNRELDGQQQQQQQQQGSSSPSPSHGGGSVQRSLTEDNARKIESAKAWRPGGNNYVDIIESFITSTECQKILQVQLLRDVQLAMIDLAKKHFDNVTSEIRKNRSNLPASVRNKLFDEKRTTRDDLIEMLDILSFEPHAAEMIMGRFPPTELEDAAPELERFLASHDTKQDTAAATTMLGHLHQRGDGGNPNLMNLSQVSAAGSSPPHPGALLPNATGGGGGGGSSSPHSSNAPGESASNVPIDGGDSRSAGVDLSQASRARQQGQRGRAIPHAQQSVPGQISFPVAFGTVSASQANPRRVNVPRKPFSGYTDRIEANQAVARAKAAESSGFGAGVDQVDDGASSLGGDSLQ